MAPRIDGLSGRARSAYDQFLQSYGDIPITSAYRDPAYNAKVGGAKGSAHVHGDAMDFSVRGLDEAQKAEVVNWWRQQGATGIGYYPNSDSIHVDLREGPNRAWGPNYSHTSLAKTPEWFQSIAAEHRGASSDGGTYSKPLQTGGATMAGYPSNAVGGLAGLGGYQEPQDPGLFSQQGMGDVLQAIGMSLMGSPSNAPLSGFGQAYGGIEDRRERKQESAADREAMMGALTMAGMSPEQAAQFAGNPKAASVAMGFLDQQRQARLKEQEMAANRSYLESLGAGASMEGAAAPAMDTAAPAGGNRLLSPGAMAETMPEIAEQPAATPIATGNKTVDYYAQKRSQLVRQLQAAPSDEAFQRGKLLLDDYDKKIEQYAPTATVREYEYAVSQGYQGGLADWVSSGGKGGTTVNVGQSEYGTIPPGFQLNRDDAGNLTMAPIPGGPEDKSRVEAAAAGNRQTSTDIVTTAAERARQAAGAEGMPATGTIGNLMANLPESNAAELRRQTEVLKATAKVDNLQAMRAASPTGGALGAVSDKESEMLAAKSGALDPSSPNFLRDLEDYERSLLRVIHGPDAGDAIFEQTRGGGSATVAPAVPAGVDPADWEYMSPEERALFQ